MCLQTIHTLMAFVFPVYFVVRLIQIISEFKYVLKYPAM